MTWSTVCMGGWSTWYWKIQICYQPRKPNDALCGLPSSGQLLPSSTPRISPSPFRDSAALASCTELPFSATRISCLGTTAVDHTDKQAKRALSVEQGSTYFLAWAVVQHLLSLVHAGGSIWGRGPWSGDWAFPAMCVPRWLAMPLRPKSEASPGHIMSYAYGLYVTYMVLDWCQHVAQNVSAGVGRWQKKTPAGFRPMLVAEQQANRFR